MNTLAPRRAQRAPSNLKAATAAHLRASELHKRVTRGAGLTTLDDLQQTIAAYVEATKESARALRRYAREKSKR